MSCIRSAWAVFDAREEIAVRVCRVLGWCGWYRCVGGGEGGGFSVCFVYSGGGALFFLAWWGLLFICLRLGVLVWRMVCVVSWVIFVVCERCGACGVWGSMCCVCARILVGVRGVVVVRSVSGGGCVCVGCAICAVCCVRGMHGVCGVGGVGDVGCVGGKCTVCGVYVECNVSVVGCGLVCFLFVGLVWFFSLWRGFSIVFLSWKGFWTLMCGLGERCFCQKKII